MGVMMLGRRRSKATRKTQHPGHHGVVALEAGFVGQENSGHPSHYSTTFSSSGKRNVLGTKAPLAYTSLTSKF
jgi:hypothetical protein